MTRGLAIVAAVLLILSLILTLRHSSPIFSDQIVPVATDELLRLNPE